MKTYEEIVKEVDKDFESYTLEDKVQAINVYSIDENNGINVRDLSKEEYETYFNDIRYNREMYLRSITIPSYNHKVMMFDILESDIKKLEPIKDSSEAKTLLDRNVVIGYYSELSYHGSSAGDYVFHEVADYDTFRENDVRFRWTWYISPNCNVKDKILAEYEQSQMIDLTDEDELGLSR